MTMAKKLRDKGFTLIETLVAITVLIIGVIGPLTITVRGITDGFFARNQIAANYLAQEAVELVLNKRMTNVNRLPPDEIWSGLSGCFGEGVICGVNNPIEPSFFVCSPLSECDLIFDKTFGYYRLADRVSAESRVGPVFRRQINMTIIPHCDPCSPGQPPDEIRMTITVKWLNFGLVRNLVVTENLYKS